jgi:hypothetical protein
MLARFAPRLLWLTDRLDRGRGRIVGVAIPGIEGGEVMSVIAAAMMGKLPCPALRDAFRSPHPAESLNNPFTAMRAKNGSHCTKQEKRTRRFRSRPVLGRLTPRGCKSPEL